MFSGDQLSWLEHLPYKQGVIGSSPISPTIYFFIIIAGIAQLVEQLTCNQQVVGSSPISGTTYGGIAKWSNAADCKSVPSGSMVQIHLPPPLYVQIASQPSGKAPHFDCGMRQFESSRGSHLVLYFVSLAQQVEHLTFNQRVRRSNRLRDTRLNIRNPKDYKGFLYFCKNVKIHTCTSPFASIDYKQTTNMLESFEKIFG